MDEIRFITEDEFEKSLHPDVLDKLKTQGFASYVGNDYSYFVMRSDKEFVDPSSKSVCFCHSICSSLPSTDKTTLCKDCAKLFIKHNKLLVEFLEKDVCNDCHMENSLIKIHSSGRQLCHSCFRISLVRLKK